MQLDIGNLASRLRECGGNFPRVILINSNEPLLLEEALDAVRPIFAEHGFAERVKHQLERGFDWSALGGAGQTMSLFSQRRLIELRVPKSLDTASTKALTEYCDNPPADDILIVMVALLNKRQRATKWFQAVTVKSWVVDGYEISSEQFPRWLKERIQSRALRVENGVIELLCEQLEGNVLAAAQEVDKLQVLAKEGALTLQLVSESLADQARFDVYALSDMCLQGNLARVLRIKNRLQSEGVEPVIVVWALAREARTLCALAAGLRAGQNKAMLFKQHRIWSKRETLFNGALQRLSLHDCHRILEQVAHLDQTIKGQRTLQVGSAWFQIEQLCAALCVVDSVGNLKAVS